MFECPICYRPRRKIVTLQCDHRVCYFCWEKWSKKETNFYMKQWPTCPCCRTEQKPWHQRGSVQRFILAISLLILYIHFKYNQSPATTALD